MENASKALSIAASVLIGVLLVALLVFAYYQFVQIPRQQEENAQLEEMAEFNKEYVVYNKENLPGNKLISLLNQAVNNNITYKDVPEYKITIIVKEENGRTRLTTDDYEQTSNKGDTRENIKNKTYKCIGVEYNSNGRISKMTFEEI